MQSAITCNSNTLLQHQSRCVHSGCQWQVNKWMNINHLLHFNGCFLRMGRQLPPQFSSTTHSRKTFGVRWHRFLRGQILFMSPNHVKAPNESLTLYPNQSAKPNKNNLWDTHRPARNKMQSMETLRCWEHRHKAQMILVQVKLPEEEPRGVHEPSPHCADSTSRGTWRPGYARLGLCSVCQAISATPHAVESSSAWLS